MNETGMEALAYLQHQGKDIPFILVTRLPVAVSRALEEKALRDQRKRTEEALRESEERFRKIFEEGPLGMAIVGLDYRFIKVNSALCRMVDYSAVRGNGRVER